MASLTLKLNATKVQRTIRRFRDRYPQAIARALNRGIVSARTDWTKNIAADVRVASAAVKKDMTTREARPNKLSASLELRGARIPLVKFPHNPKAPPSRGRGSGVSVRLPGGAGRYRHAFIAQMRTGHIGVFSRTRHTRGAPVYGRRGRARWEKIDELKGPSLPYVSAKHIPSALARGETSLIKNLRSELRFAIQSVAA